MGYQKNNETKKRNFRATIQKLGLSYLTYPEVNVALSPRHHQHGGGLLQRQIIATFRWRARRIQRKSPMTWKFRFRQQMQIG